MSSAPAGAEMKVTSRITAKVDICDGCTPNVRLPLAIEGLTAVPKVRVVDVAFAGAHPSALVTALTAAVTGDVTAPELSLTIAPGQFRAQGSYQVMLEFTSGTEKPVTVALELTRPAATLQAFSPIVVERVQGAPWDDAEVTQPVLMLRETSKRSNVTGLGVLPPNPQPVTGRIEIDTTPLDCFATNGKPPTAGAVPADGARCLSYRLSGTVPKGTLTQTYTLTANELTAGVPLTFEVRSRLARWYVCAFALLGLIASYIVKVGLQHRLQRAEARLAGADLLQLVRTDVLQNPDGPFTKAVENELKALEQAMSAGDAATIGEARKALDDKWRMAKQDLSTRRQTVQQRIDVLRGVVETEWDVPPAIAAAVASAGPEVKAARERFTAGHVSEVDDALTAITHALATRTRTAILDWQTAVPGMLTAIQNAPTGISPATQTAVASAFETAKANIGSAKVSQTATADDMSRGLSGVSDERLAGRRAVTALVDVLTGEAAAAGAALADSAAVARVMAAIETAATPLLAAVEDPSGGRVTAIAALALVHQSWVDSLTTASGGTVSPAAGQQIQERRYVEAAQTITAELRLQNEADEAEPPSLADLVIDTVKSASRFSAPTHRAHMQAFVTVHTSAVDLERPAVVRANSLREIATIKAVQSLVAGLFALLIGYGLFAPKFIGDYQDFVIIAFWAFTLDLSIDAVSKLAPTARR